jgi:ABC-type transport system involved in multi-copper enzyme maturation permease subunit
MKSTTADIVPLVELPVTSRYDPAALAALFTLTLRQHLRGRRLLILSLLFLLPSILAAVVRLAPHAPEPEDLEFAFVFNFIPHALVPLVALLYAAGMIQDEVEEQTLTYLLTRTLPRRALYVTRLLATWLMTAVLTGVFTTLAYAVIWWGHSELWGDVLPVKAAKTAGLLALSQLGYCSLFGAVGLFTRRSLFTGLAYIVAFEGLLANIPMMVRQLTVMYYFRVLAARWLAPAHSDVWSLDLDTAPSNATCLKILLIGSAVLALFGAQMMARQEFRMKTPDGS